MSKFVLCPRGLGTSSNRLYEVMQLGRVPVILSDDWDEPGGIPWATFSIRVSESRVAQLRAILERHAPVAAEMGARALSAWHEFCEPGPALLRNLLAAIEDISNVRPGDWDEALVHTRWTSTRFLWANGIHPAQGAYAAYRSGQLIPPRPARQPPCRDRRHQLRPSGRLGRSARQHALELDAVPMGERDSSGAGCLCGLPRGKAGVSNRTCDAVWRGSLVVHTRRGQRRSGTLSEFAVRAPLVGRLPPAGPSRE